MFNSERTFEFIAIYDSFITIEKEMFHSSSTTPLLQPILLISSNKILRSIYSYIHTSQLMRAKYLLFNTVVISFLCLRICF